MEPALLLLLTVAAFATAALSATFGMAGGLLLMGLYTSVLPVPAAMVLHGVTQLVANGGRAVALRSHVHTRGVGHYLAGAAVAWILLHFLRWSPSESTVLLGLGLVPFVALALPAGPLLDFAHRRGALLCGALVVGTQLAFGVAGPLLDVFFVRGGLERHAVVATKAVTQALSHTLKILFFLPILGGFDTDLALAALLTVLGALVGTRVGAKLLDRIGEATFRRWTRRLVLAIGATFLVRGVWAL